MANSGPSLDWAISQGANAIESDLHFDNNGNPTHFDHGGICDCICAVDDNHICNTVQTECEGLGASENAITHVQHIARLRSVALVFIDSKVDANMGATLTKAGSAIIPFLDKYLFANGYQGQVIISSAKIDTYNYLRAAATTSKSSPNMARYFFTFDQEADNYAGVMTILSRFTNNRVYGTGSSSWSHRERIIKAGVAGERNGEHGMTYIWTLDKKSSMQEYINLGVQGIMTNRVASLKNLTISMDLKIAQPSDTIPISITPISSKHECDCDYQHDGCVISMPPPKNTACKCTKRLLGCDGSVVPCSNPDSPYCVDPDLSSDTCALGGGNFWVKYTKLRQDYHKIPSLPISPIPFIGNIHQFDKRQDVFSRLLMVMARECQQQQQQQAKGLFCLCNNAKWRARRRLITPSFHDTQLLHNFMLIFNEQSCVFARRLEECISVGDEPKAYDLYPYISTCTLDIIAESALGKHVEAQSSGGKNKFVEATGRVCGIINHRIRSPWMWPTWIFDRLPIGREQAERLNILHGVSRKIIEDRLATFNAENTTSNSEKKTTRRLVFLDSLLAQMNSEQLTLDDIQEEVDTFMFEGHDTTAAAVNFTCYLIGSHPDVQAKLHAEIDDIFSDGQTIRKGTTVYIFIYGVHHDSNAFPQPERFDPDRFHQSSVTNEERSPFAFVPFSAGSRNCIGQRFALLEEKVILSTLLRQYSLRATQTIDELQLSFEAIMRPTVPIKLFIEHRKFQ
ncbi:unnamed protein product [Rotaria sp. Silwood1]|nr:unnamed protein product [Rotaria sp. Silwood1]